MNKATELLRDEHRQAEQLFARFASTSDRDVALELCDLLERHMAMEEQVVYPALREADEELSAEAQHEHDEAAQLVARIRAAGDADLAALVQELKEGIEHHVSDEEEQVLPKMEEACGEERMDALGQQLEQWRSARGGGGAGAGAGGRDLTEVEDPEVAAEREQLGELTKDELYERAKEAEVPGRSSMTKDELASELAEG